MNRTLLFVELLSGMLAMGYAVAGLFFLRFWRDSRDRLFAYFAVAFFLLSMQRILVTVYTSPSVYAVRLLAFVLILWAIIDKNRAD